MNSNENAGRHPILFHAVNRLKRHSTARPLVCPREYDIANRIQIHYFKI